VKGVKFPTLVDRRFVTDLLSIKRNVLQNDILPFSVDSGGIFGKKFASTSRFVVSSKVWMNTIPTHDCDVLLTFPAKTDDHTLMWLLARLRSRTPEMEVHVRHHSNTGVYGF
jgi:hypothetical protein